MSWFNNIMEVMTFANNNSKCSEKEIHFRIVNNTEKPINVKIFNEDTSEICEEDDYDYGDDCDEFEDDTSGVFNGYEALSATDLMPNQRWTYKRECTCMDCHVGTILVDTLENLYYFDAAKGATKDSISVMDSSALITSIKESTPAAEEEDDDDSDDDEGSVSAFVCPHITKERSSMQSVMLEEEVMDIQIEDVERDDNDDSSSSLPPIRVITLIIENQPIETATRQRWLSQGTLEASIAQLECNFAVMGGAGAQARRPTFRDVRPQNYQAKTILDMYS